VLGLLLAPFGVEMVEAENGAAALEALKASPIDMVLMDVNMPVMDGLTATRAIRASHEPWAGLPIIAVTAAAAAEDMRRSAEAGADADPGAAGRTGRGLRASSALAQPRARNRE
jgi:CheY-like chemotaxis protein